MKKIYVGIDISKEKCNLCYQKDLAVVREEECVNDVKGIKKALKASFMALGVLPENFFMDSHPDCALLLCPEGWQAIVSLHVDGITIYPIGAKKRYQ